MHVAIRRYSLSPEVQNDLKQRLDADFVPRLRNVKGFVSYYAVSTGPESLVTVSVFETKEEEQESTRLATDFVQRNYANQKIERIGLDEGPCIVQHHAAIPAY